MSKTVEIHSGRLELDNAFHNAVTLAWDDLKKPIKPRSIGVEYLSEPGIALDHVSVWSVQNPGYEDLVYDYWTPNSSAHKTSTHFANGYYSRQLAQTLEFIMSHQGQFTRPANGGRHGLVRIHPPQADDRTEAAAWMSVVQALESERGTVEASVLPENHSRQDEEAWSRMDDEGHSNEGSASLPDATGYSDYEWSSTSRVNDSQ